ncbi:glucose-1-phosphate adenylyltransferase [Corallincola luteus]|uniref:Glucose-1-phosphate adenylyltransferase n=1 Tax=Corallincola luteus TaxID=1775177 RepID=A0ABY2AQP5_9GAMM|nr:glucose-1-phosphate adenylyltransferase [Corallincola luteus]TCI04103.1 glucose-1-phosphate adenylyltransferase [Corallincola luteus]
MHIVKKPARFFPDVCQRTYTLVLAGGRGTRLHDLTQARAKPATFFGGKYRIIDFTLSNCINSGFHRIGVLTQYNAFYLIAHIQRTWARYSGEHGEYVGILPAEQRKESDWYSGTANAVYQNLWLLERQPIDFVLILAGDHVYTMDYLTMMDQHDETGSDITISTMEVPLELGSLFGVVLTDEHNRITGFVEKPVDCTPYQSSPGKVRVSMGIYGFRLQALSQLLHEDAKNLDSQHDFGYDVLPKALAEGYVMHAHDFIDEDGLPGYWRDVGTIEAYYDSNMELLAPLPRLNLYNPVWPITSYQEQRAPGKLSRGVNGEPGTACDSLISAGSIISGAEVTRSVLSYDVCIAANSEVNHCILLPQVKIGKNCHINHAIVDEECEIPDGTVIGDDAELDAERFLVTDDGIVVVTKERLNRI